MKEMLYMIISGILGVVLWALIYSLIGSIYYLGLPVIGVNITFTQSIVLALLISVTGRLFFGLTNAKGDE